MTRRALVLVLAACAFAVPAHGGAHTTPYAGQQARTIKALSSEDVAALLNAEGMGMAKAAELNGYPGPVHVLTLAKELKLTTPQQQQIQAIYDRNESRGEATRG
jgi:Spy/CpxP family protein refolding chaperone